MQVLIFLVMILKLAWAKLIYQPFIEGTKHQVRGSNSLEDLVVLLGNTEWVKDGWKELWDSIGSAEHFQYTLDSNRIPKAGRDCDEFAVYAYAAGIRTPGLHIMQSIITVHWTSPSWWIFRKFGGHHVCAVVDEKQQLRHIGNWGMFPRGEVGYTSLRNLAFDVYQNSAAYREGGPKFLGFSVWQPGDWSAKIGK